jgi:hypothetical protein
LTLALGLVAFGLVNTASAAAPDDDGFLRGRGPGGRGRGGSGDFAAPAYLAEVLGISTDELQDAYRTAQDAAIDQALADGLITQAQADRLTNGNFRFLRMLVGPDNDIDLQAFLAEALGISTTELDEAIESARDAAIEQAVADGRITEEQAAVMQARQALKEYIDQDAVTAEALGIPVEELEAAGEDGQRIPDLLDELELDLETFQANLQAAHEEALQQAVQDNVITQEQADLLLESGFGLHCGPGRGGMRGRQGFGGSADNDFRPAMGSFNQG